MSKRSDAFPTLQRERAFLVGVLTPRSPSVDDEPPLLELEGLVESAGAFPVGEAIQNLPGPHPQTYVGKGKVQEIADQAKALRCHLIVTDDDLTPLQIRNLEEKTGIRTIDRSELILAIFAQQARTKESKVQVELAQLEYTLPRLQRMWTHLHGEQIRGGIGMRGPGETQIESDRRMARSRIQHLKQQIREIRERREAEVSLRASEYSVGLVGYTNAGKSSLMNRLTGAGVLVENRMFSTLDTRTRKMKLPRGGHILISDTVGFIRKLPHHLVSSFQATLQEARWADLLLMVVDLSDPDPVRQVEEVRAVLDTLECKGKILAVLNKIDAPSHSGHAPALLHRYPDAVSISAKTGEGLPELVKRIEEEVELQREEWSVSCSAAEGAFLAAVAEKCRVVSQRRPDSERVSMRLRMLPQDWPALKSRATGPLRARKISAKESP